MGRWNVTAVLCIAGLVVACAGADGPTDGPEEAAVDEEPVAAVEDQSEEPPDDGVAEPVCETFAVATLDDDRTRAAFWAIETGDTRSENIGSYDIVYTTVPALIEAAGTDQFDVTETSLPGVVNARERGGLDMRLVAVGGAHTGGGGKIFVRTDSGIDEPGDLDGATLGTTSFGSTSFMVARLVLEESHGLDAAEEGPISFAELSPAPLLNALEVGQVDAAYLQHEAGWLAMENPELEILVDVDNEYRELTGAWPYTSAFVTTGDVLDERGECVREFQADLERSVNTARDQIADIAPQIAEELGSDEDFLVYWWGDAYDFGGSTGQQYLDGAMAFWEFAARHGEIPTVPDLEEILVQ